MASTSPTGSPTGFAAHISTGLTKRMQAIPSRLARARLATSSTLHHVPAFSYFEVLASISSERSLRKGQKRMLVYESQRSTGIRAAQGDALGNNNMQFSAESGSQEETVRRNVDAILDTIKWDDKGLVVAIAQHIDTGAILMQGFANRDAVSATITSGRATFYSRSRSSLWTKGETSSNFINVMDVFLDCDRDSIIYLGDPDGPTCHTGAETCYFTPASEIGKGIQAVSKRFALTTLYSLEETIGQRKAEIVGTSTSESTKPSWTKKLLKDHGLLCSKIREEADELCRTLEDNEGKSRTASEMADVLYHSMVLLAVQDVKLEDVVEILRARFTQTGIEEKNSRKRDTPLT